MMSEPQREIGLCEVKLKKGNKENAKNVSITQTSLIVASFEMSWNTEFPLNHSGDPSRLHSERNAARVLAT